MLLSYLIDKIIYKNLETGRYKYLDKKNNLYETLVDHVSNIYGKAESDNIKNLYENNISRDEILRDDNIAGLYIIKINEIYVLCKKTVELRNNGWIRNNIIPEVQNIRLAEYFEAEL